MLPPQSDDECLWDSAKFRCKWTEICRYSYQLGDLSFAASCRLLPELTRTWVALQGARGAATPPPPARSLGWWSEVRAATEMRAFPATPKPMRRLRRDRQQRLRPAIDAAPRFRFRASSPKQRRAGLAHAAEWSSNPALAHGSAVVPPAPLDQHAPFAAIVAAALGTTRRHRATDTARFARGEVRRTLVPPTAATAGAALLERGVGAVHLQAPSARHVHKLLPLPPFPRRRPYAQAALSNDTRPLTAAERARAVATSARPDVADANAEVDTASAVGGDAAVWRSETLPRLVAEQRAKKRDAYFEHEAAALAAQVAAQRQDEALLRERAENVAPFSLAHRSPAATVEGAAARGDALRRIALSDAWERNGMGRYGAQRE